MKLLGCILLTVSACMAQDSAAARQAVGSIFTTPSPDTSFLGEYELVPEEGQQSLEYLPKCGEGRNQGVNLCVPYYNCDGVTKTIVLDGLTDGFGIIDIRAGEDAPCDHYLDTCCGLPPGGFPVNTTLAPPTVLPPTDPPFTNRPPTVPTRPSGGGVTPPVIPPTRPTPPVNDASNHCGIRNVNGIDFQISGAENEAEFAEFPWMVAILKKTYDPKVDKSLAICGGSIITPNVILTGAHCVNVYKTTDLKVRAGEWDTQTTRERIPFQERDISEIIIRSDFHPHNLYNDVALLILSTPLNKAQNLGTICLPPPNLTVNSKNCFASGWGKYTFGLKGQYSNILKKIELPIVPFDQCQNALRTTRLGNYFQLHRSFTCAGGEEGKDACTGDGGSPLVCPDPQNPGRYIQAGIVAWGIGCGEQGVPGVYVDVAKFREWIDQELRQRQIEPLPYTV